MRRRIADEAWGELTVRLGARDNGRFDGIVFGKGGGAVAKVYGEHGETEGEVRARLKQEALRHRPDWLGFPVPCQQWYITRKIEAASSGRQRATTCRRSGGTS